MSSCGSRIKSLRESKGYTQTQLAEKSGVSQSNITMYERDERMPGLNAIVSLADAFGVSCDYLIKGLTEEVKSVSENIHLSYDAIQRLMVTNGNSPVISLINALLETDENTLNILAVQFSIYCSICYYISDNRLRVSNINAVATEFSDPPEPLEIDSDVLEAGMAENCKAAFLDFLHWAKNNASLCTRVPSQIEMSMSPMEDSQNARND